MGWIAVVLGIVEGLTEFLPVSSTGHLILAGHLMDFSGKRAEVFQIVIQFGAILSVVWEFRARLGAAARTVRIPLTILVAFLPSAVIGLAVHDLISDRLFAPVPVAAALIAGALLIFLVEGLPRRADTHAPETASWKQALGIGFAQCASLWPGFSRSAATILGGLVCGLDRRAATEFSFFLAVPTMAAASGYDLLKNREFLVPGDAGWLALSFVVSFLVAWASVRWLLRFVATHTFRAFAWYRIALGIAVLLLWR